MEFDRNVCVCVCLFDKKIVRVVARADKTRVANFRYRISSEDPSQGRKAKRRFLWFRVGSAECENQPTTSRVTFFPINGQIKFYNRSSVTLSNDSVHALKLLSVSV